MSSTPREETKTDDDPFAGATEPDEHGVLSTSIEMSRNSLVAAYRCGAFPFPLRGVVDLEQDVLAWISPPQRAILEFDELRMRQTTERSARRSGWRVSVDQACAEVIAACADRDEVWIDQGFVDAYLDLHSIGLVHSFEIWEEDRLVGGVYGVLLGRLFFAESMFHRRPDAGKYALFKAADRLRDDGATWMDVQYLSDHLRRLGAKEIPRDDFLERLATAVTAPQIDLSSG